MTLFEAQLIVSGFEDQPEAFTILLDYYIERDDTENIEKTQSMSFTDSDYNNARTVIYKSQVKELANGLKPHNLVRYLEKHKSDKKYLEFLRDVFFKHSLDKVLTDMILNAELYEKRFGTIAIRKFSEIMHHLEKGFAANYIRTRIQICKLMKKKNDFETWKKLAGTVHWRCGNISWIDTQQWLV